jgi:glyoxylase-like metal-dependent hydrolase (beta-lactamase superfamily II)
MIRSIKPLKFNALWSKSSWILFLLISVHFKAQKIDYLIKCWNKQVGSLEKNILNISYTENYNTLEHDFNPWDQTNYNIEGKVWIGKESYNKVDKYSKENKEYNSVIQLSKDKLLFMNYGENKISPVTKEDMHEQIYLSAKYSPLFLINYFKEQKVKIDKESENKEFAVYKTVINKSIVRLFINKNDALLKKVTILSDDELFGDVLSVFNYKDYINDKIYYPKNISIEKINGKLIDEIKISKLSTDTKVPNLLSPPENFTFKESNKLKPEIKLEKYNDNIYFLELRHTDDRVLIVDFKDFMLVAEAPINSENGETIINEVKKIAPNKPIKYFAFGHFHPHYIGGIRSFVHSGANIIYNKYNKDYVDYIVNAPHTINPDRLQSEPKKIKTLELKDKLNISDGNYEMEIYYIGKKSDHTIDYQIYYFPKEKLLFQDDLVWISKNGDPKKAGTRQEGLYKAIKDLNLDVKTIIQSWPVADYGVKTIIPFDELEKTINIK